MNRKLTLTGTAGMACLFLMATQASAQIATLAEARALARETGRPILTVAGREG